MRYRMVLSWLFGRVRRRWILAVLLLPAPICGSTTATAGIGSPATGAATGAVDPERSIAQVHEGVRILETELPSLAALAILAEDPEVRAKAWQVGSTAGWHLAPEPVARVALAALCNGRFEQKRRAVEVIRALGPQATEAVSVLRRILREHRDELAVAAAEALGEIGDTSAISELSWLYRHQHELSYVHDASVAPVALAKLGFREIIPVLAKDLDSESNTRRRVATRALSFFGFLPPDLVDRMARLCEADAEEATRVSCLRAIRQSGRPSEARTRALLACLADQRPSVRLVAFRAAAAMRAVPPSVVDAIMSLARTADGVTAFQAEAALITMGEDAIGPLAAYLIEDGQGSAQWAASLLARMPPEGYQVLATAAVSPDPSIARTAIRAISGADESEESRRVFEPVLASVLTGPHRALAIQPICDLRCRSLGVVAGLAALARDNELGVADRVTAVKGLGELARSSRIASQRLLDLSQSDDLDAAVSAAVAEAVASLKQE